MLKKIILGTLTTLLLLNFSLLEAQEGYRERVIGECQGVPAYSNEEDTGTEYGPRQCTKYVKRFLVEHFGIPDEYKGWGESAADWWFNCQNAGFSGFKQGGTIPPLPNMILCFDGGTWGHVAIIKEVNVSAGKIRIVHQNYSRDQGEMDLSLSVNGGKYIVQNLGSLKVQGWLGLPFLYPSGTLIKTSDNPDVYAVIRSQKFLIPDEATYYAHGFSWNNVIEVTDQEMSSHEYKGSILSSEPSLSITFFRDSRDKLFKIGTKAYLYDYTQDAKRAIHSYEIMQSWGYDWADLVDGSAYKNKSDGYDFWYRDGTLVRSYTNSAVYVVEQGRLRAFESWELFIAMGYDVGNIIWMTENNITNNVGFYGKGDMLTADNIWRAVVQSGFTGSNYGSSGVVPYLSVSVSNLDFGQSTTTLHFQISSNTSWSISDNASWVNCSPSSGYGDMVVAVTVDRSNLSSGNYSATISSDYIDGSKKITVSCSKADNPGEAGGLVTSVEKLNFGKTETKIRFDVLTEESWTMIVSNSWIYAIPKSWTGDKVVEVTVDRSQLQEGTHTGSVTIEHPSGSKVLDVIVIKPSSGTVSTLMVDEGFNSGLGVFQKEINNNAGQIYWENGTAVLNTASASERYNIQLKTFISVEQGKSYEVELQLKADKTRDVHFQLMKDSQPYTDYDCGKSLSIGASWNTYSFTIVPNQSDQNARFAIQSGDMSGKVYVNFIKIGTEGLNGDNPDDPPPDDPSPDDPNPDDPPTSDLMVDEGFNSGLGVFQKEINNNAGQIYCDNGSAVVEVMNGGNIYNIQLITLVDVKKGSEYYIQFEAKSDKPRSVQVQLLKHTEPWTDYGLCQSVEVDSDWDVVYVPFIPNSTDSKARIAIQCGNVASRISINYIKIGLKDSGTGDNPDDPPSDDPGSGDPNPDDPVGDVILVNEDFNSSGSCKFDVEVNNECGYSYFEDGKIVLEIINPQTQYHLQLESLIPIESGKLYFVEVTSWSDQDRNLSYQLLKHTEPWTDYGTGFVKINSVQKTYSFEFTAITTDNAARFAFQIGETAGKVYIDNIRIGLVGGSGGGLTTDISHVKYLPKGFILLQNYPNPFNPSTNIEFSLPELQVVNLVIYNNLGQEMARLIDNRQMNAGEHRITFDATDFPAGIYFYRLNAGEFNSIQKMLYIK